MAKKKAPQAVLPDHPYSDIMTKYTNDAAVELQALVGKLPMTATMIMTVHMPDGRAAHAFGFSGSTDVPDGQEGPYLEMVFQSAARSVKRMQPEARRQIIRKH